MKENSPRKNSIFRINQLADIKFFYGHDFFLFPPSCSFLCVHKWCPEMKSFLSLFIFFFFFLSLEERLNESLNSSLIERVNINFLSINGTESRECSSFRYPGLLFT